MKRNSNVKKNQTHRMILATLISLLILLGSTSAGAQSTVVEDFEDGDVAGWSTGATNGIIQAVTTPISPSGGSYVGKVTFGSSCWGPSRAFEPVVADYVSFYFRADGDTGHPSGVGVFLSGSDGLIGQVSYHQGALRYRSDDVVYQPIVSASMGTWYLIEFRNIDWDSDTFDIWVDGVEYLVGVTMYESNHDVSGVVYYACPWVSGPMYLDDITFGSDTTPPLVNVPLNITVPQENLSGAVVTFSVSATDETSPANPAVTCDWNSGDTFPLGTTSVTCSATDDAGNTGYGYFDVTVTEGLNLLKKPSFDNATAFPTPWKAFGFRPPYIRALDCTVFNFGPCSVLFPAGNRAAYQQVNLVGHAGDTYSFGMYSAANNGGGTYRVELLFYNNFNKLLGSNYLDFNAGTHDFELVNGSATAPVNYNKIIFRFVYQNSTGRAWFDDAFLYFLGNVE